jgi:vacuolar protein-sorting-associated protein 4
MVPLPCLAARKELLSINLGCHSALSPEDLEILASKTEGYSGSDLCIIANDALMQPVRELETCKLWKKICSVTEPHDCCEQCEFSPTDEEDEAKIELTFAKIPPKQVKTRQVSTKDVLWALNQTQRSVFPQDLDQYQNFAKTS